MLEKDLFPPLKKHFNERGYRVYAEVPLVGRCVDFVAVKENNHIAVEMKRSFSKDVVRQANWNTVYFHESYIAIPKTKIRNEEENEKISWVHRNGIGILQIYPLGTIFYHTEAIKQKPIKEYDFSTFEERDDDEAGIRFQKGVSAAFTVLDRIKEYVKKNPKADWDEIYVKVQNHYSSSLSLRGAMSQWKGFNLKAYKHHLYIQYLAEKGRNKLQTINQKEEV